MNRRIFLAAVALSSLAACSSVETAPVDPSGKGTPIYFISAKQADGIMKTAMVEAFPKLPIMKVDAPHQGYTASMNFALDQHSVTLMAVPVVGELNGSRQDGFSFKVTQYGSMPLTGGSKASKLIETVERMTAGAPKLTPLLR